MKLPIFLLILCLCRAEDPVHFVSHKVLQVSPNSSSSWDLADLFASKNSTNAIKEKRISSFRVEGPSPCTVDDPALLLSAMLFLEDDLEILDFATVDNNLYYVTEDGIYRVDAREGDMIESLTKIASIIDERFSYIEAFKLSDGRVLLMLKGVSSQFAYVVTSRTNIGEPKISYIGGSFDTFTEDMKLTMVSDHLLIPAKTKGIYLYAYERPTRSLRHLKTFSSIDIQDITAAPSSKDRIVGYLCDFRNGIAPYELNLESMEMNHREFMEEFIGAKTVSWISHAKDDKLLVIQEGLYGSGKVAVLSINLQNLTDLKYDNIRLLDGTPRYGNAGNQYTSIVMPYSVFVMENNEKSDSMYKYFNIENVSHAKIYNNGEHSWLISAFDNQIIGTYIFRHDGFLVCEVESNIKNNEFFILGHSHVCGADENNVAIKSCYYRVNVTLQLWSKSYHEVIAKYEFTGLIIILVAFALIVALVVFCIRVIKMASQAQNILQGYSTADLEPSPTTRKLELNNATPPKV
eukprot:TRINITY_DN17236_c0_g1_i10.p1 TRINITY_DN17236_c0_g1~~TRINITY_DN17236_c0_g1_i10.p1  ORF type:complete len:519 (+),score=114.98 TRINITY_DN17236_c0_g1_i10:174-1730(+)